MSFGAALIVSGFARSMRFYTDVLGFATMRFEPGRRWAQMERDGVSIELHEAPGGALAALEYPYGRGVTLQIWTHDAEAVYAGVQAYGARLHVPLRESWREEEGSRVGHLEFEVVDPDGYQLRFLQVLPPQRI